jgi:hypothetical protein
MCSIYQKLNGDLQEKIDKIISDKVKEEINMNDIKEELQYRKLYYGLLNLNIYDEKEKQLIRFVCFDIIRPRIYGKGYCGFESKSGKYEYIIEKGQNAPLIMYIEQYTNFLDKGRIPNLQPAYDFLKEAINLAIDNWVAKYIISKELFEEFSRALNFSIIDMFEFYFDNTGENPFDDYNYKKKIFTWYLIEMFDNIIMKSYGNLILFMDDTDEDNTDDTDDY